METTFKEVYSINTQCSTFKYCIYIYIYNLESWDLNWQCLDQQLCLKECLPEFLLRHLVLALHLRKVDEPNWPGFLSFRLQALAHLFLSGALSKAALP